MRVIRNSALAVRIAQAVVLVWLVALQATTPRPGGAAGRGDGATMAVVGEHCDLRDGAAAPDTGKSRTCSADCCLFCNSANGRDGLCYVAAHGQAADEPPISPVHVGRRSSAPDIDRRPLGWTSSWSSRAPPVFC